MLKSQRMTISPEVAAQWIEKSKTHNRRLRLAHVKQLAIDMASGTFALNGETIIIATNGNILDGHHRLHACVRANVPFETFVVLGVDPETMPTIDTGDSRNRSDLMTFAGELHASKLCTTTKLVWLAERGRLKDAYIANRELGLTPQEHLAVLDRHPDVRNHMNTGTSYYRQFPLIMLANYAFFSYWLARYDKTLAESFLEAVASGENLEATDPAQLLRKRLINNATAKTKYRSIEMLALVVKAWRYHATGTPVHQLRWNTTEAFPELDPMN